MNICWLLLELLCRLLLVLGYGRTIIRQIIDENYLRAIDFRI